MIAHRAGGDHDEHLIHRAKTPRHQSMDEHDQTAWWQRTQALAGVTLLGLSFVIVSPLMVSAHTTAFGMPLSYFLAAIAVPVVLVVGIFWVSGRQERLDRRHRASGV